MDRLLRVRGLTRIFGEGCLRCFGSTGPDLHTRVCPHCGSVVALRGVSFDLRRGECVVVTGPPGAGKSTLLRLLALRDRATRGSATLYDRGVHHDLFELGQAREGGLRGRRFDLLDGPVWMAADRLPPLVYLDEPTRGLGPEAGEELLRRLSRACGTGRITALVATEDPGTLGSLAHGRLMLDFGRRVRSPLSAEDAVLPTDGTPEPLPA